MGRGVHVPASALMAIALSTAATALLVVPPVNAADIGMIISGTTTIAIEASPEFHAISSGSNAAGSYADTAPKASVTHTFANNWSLHSSFQADIKNNSTYQYFAETSVGYRLKFDHFTLTPSAALGDTWDSTGLGLSGNANAFYYAFYLAGDLKLDSRWTWNAFDLRYRNAFDYNWITPKVTTGLTYAMSSRSSVYSNVGYSWKDTGNGLLGDKFNVTFGVKYNF
jgi:hypothetical protein